MLPLPRDDLRRRRRRIVLTRILIALLVLGAVVVTLRVAPWARTSAPQHARVIDWVRNGPGGHDAWRVFGGRRCAGAPMLVPTDGFIGYGWGDAFHPGHHHTGFDIFSPDGAENVTPVFAAYDGLLTREADWRSAVILRHPTFPADFPPLALRPPAGGAIWTYYAHMASADGATSFIAPAFPPGTRDRPVRSGELLGYQGTWSGDPSKPVGLHLHFSIVEGAASGNASDTPDSASAHTPDGASDGAPDSKAGVAANHGGYGNETDPARTYDPAPFLGVARDADGVLVCDAWAPFDGRDPALPDTRAPSPAMPATGLRPPP